MIRENLLLCIILQELSQLLQFLAAHFPQQGCELALPFIAVAQKCKL